MKITLYIHCNSCGAEAPTVVSTGLPRVDLAEAQAAASQAGFVQHYEAGAEPSPWRDYCPACAAERGIAKHKPETCISLGAVEAAREAGQQAAGKLPRSAETCAVFRAMAKDLDAESAALLAQAWVDGYDLNAVSPPSAAPSRMRSRHGR